MNIFYVIGWFLFGYYVIGSLAGIFVSMKIATWIGVIAGLSGSIFFWKYLK